MNIDIVSDLHIDHWSNDISCKYPYGVKKHFPLNVIKSDSDYLIVAGDISDDINLSVNYLNYISKNSYNAIAEALETFRLSI